MSYRWITNSASTTLVVHLYDTKTNWTLCGSRITPAAEDEGGIRCLRCERQAEIYWIPAASGEEQA